MILLERVSRLHFASFVVLLILASVVIVAVFRCRYSPLRKEAAPLAASAVPPMLPIEMVRENSVRSAKTNEESLDILQKAKEEFAAEHDLHSFGSVHGGTFQFYLALLNSDDPKLATAAFQFLAESLAGERLDVVPSSVSNDPDKMEMRGALLALQTGVQSFNSLELIAGNAAILNIIEQVIPRLKNENENTDAALVLDMVTFGVYRGNDVEWWTEEFNQSELAKILRQTPQLPSLRQKDER